MVTTIEKPVALANDIPRELPERSEVLRIQARAKQLLALNIEYFECTDVAESNHFESSPDGDAVRLLTIDEEVAMFREMNLSKQQADALRGSLSAGSPSIAIMDEIDQRLARSVEIRNRLVQIFMKLARSIARSFSNLEHPLDELVSEASMTLLRAIEKYDCERGFRFSTYATHAVRRNLLRYLSTCRKQRHSAVPTSELDGVVESRKWTWGYEQRISRAANLVTEIMSDMEPRDRYILRSRVGLDGDCHGQSLQRIADQLGVSRERVRQLEQRATSRLRAMAKERDFESIEA